MALRTHTTLGSDSTSGRRKAGAGHLFAAAVAASAVIALAGTGCLGASRAKNARAAAARKVQLQKAKAPWTSGKPDHLDLARDLVRQRLYDVAVPQLKKAAATSPRDPEIRYLLGVCERESGDLPGAVRSFRKALKLDSQYAPAYHGLGLTYCRLRQPRPARNALQKAVRLNPARAEFHNDLGYLALVSGQLKEAEASFRRSIALTPQYTVAVNNLGICLVLAGRPDEAEEAFRRVMSPAAALNNMGAVYEERGELDKAAAMYARALAQDPSLKEARTNLARVRAHTKDVGGKKPAGETNAPTERSQ